MKGIYFDAKNSPISFLDLEMTGLEGSRHEIVEIGLVKVSQPNLEVIEKWEAKVKPKNLENADPTSLKISGYDEEKWKDSISLDEMMKILSEKVRNSILAGWNISTDYAFLDFAVTKTGIPLDFHKKVLDVNSYAAAKLTYEWGELGLSALSKKFGLEFEGHHTALADAQACFEVYRVLKFMN